MPGMTAGGSALCLAAADAAATAALVIWMWRRLRSQAAALEDARHEFETGLAFLDGRLRARRGLLCKLPPINDEGA